MMITCNFWGCGGKITNYAVRVRGECVSKYYVDYIEL